MNFLSGYVGSTPKRNGTGSYASYANSLCSLNEALVECAGSKNFESLSHLTLEIQAGLIFFREVWKLVVFDRKMQLFQLTNSGMNHFLWGMSGILIWV